MSNLQDGQRYIGRPTGASSVYENDNTNLILCMEIELEGEHLRYYCALATEKDGINIKNVERCKKLFGWDGVDPFWFVDHGADYTETEVECTIEMRQGSKSDKWFPSIKYMDPPGGGADVPEIGDRTALSSKYASKFRAIAGETPAASKKFDTPPTASPSLPPKTPPSIPPAGKLSDQMTCWGRFVELGGDDNGWFVVLAQSVPGVDQGDLTPAQWGKVLDHIETTTIPM